MPDIKLYYMYRDYANYKNYGKAIFANPDKYSLEEVDKALRAQLLDGVWFYASRWGLKDLHFEKYDDENDHPYHEFIDVKLTDEKATEAVNVTELMERVRKAGCEW